MCPCRKKTLYAISSINENTPGLQGYSRESVLVFVIMIAGVIGIAGVIRIAALGWRAVSKAETQNKGGLLRDVDKRWHFYLLVVCEPMARG